MRARRARVAAVCLASLALLVAPGSEAAPSPSQAALACSTSEDPVEAAWTPLLRAHVTGAGVDYAALQRERPALDRVLQGFSARTVQDVAKLPRAGQIAFWINVYNGFTVRLVLDHLPLKSIRSIGFLPGAAFRDRFIAIGDERLSLNAVEDRLRAFGDPRIHFAIVCASRSCPALRREAYRCAELDAQLADAARTFLADTRKNRLERDGVVHLSAIFKWYRDDFAKAAGSAEEFAARHAAGALAQALRRPGARVEFLDYDWSLNAP